MTVEEACRTLIPGYDPWRDADGYAFDAARAEEAVGFFRDMLCYPDGEKAHEPFDLQPWQQAVVGNLHGWRATNGKRRYKEAFVLVPRKNGKMLALDTVLPTPTGWTTMGEVRVGSRLFDENGKICKVIAVSDIDLDPESYRIEFSNGDSVRACADHQWVTTARVNAVGAGVGSRDGSAGWNSRNRTRVRTTKELFETQTYGIRGDRNHSLEMPQPLELEHADLPLDPYVLGAWLGDGTTECAMFTCDERDWFIVEEISRRGIPTRLRRSGKGRPACVAFSGGRSGSKIFSVQGILRRMGVLGNKHIPRQYLRSSRCQRIQLLQGLMDTDGTVSKNGRVLEISSVKLALAEGIAELLATLGVKYSWRVTKARCNGRDLGTPVYRIQFMAFRDELEAFRLPRKLERMRFRRECARSPRSKTVQISRVERIQPTPMRCIAVDSPSHQFLFGRTMLPTHNSAMSAGMMLLEMFMSPTPGGQYFSAAADREQAALIFNDAVQMVKNNGELSELVRIVPSGKVIQRVDDTGGLYKALSSDAGTKHGLRPCFVIIDELHAHRNANLVEALTTGTAVKGLQPLVIYITTADYIRESVCNSKYKYACQVRDGEAHDPGFLPVVYEAHGAAWFERVVDKNGVITRVERKADDWTSEAVWRKANPNYGISVDEDYLVRECEKAKVDPVLEIGFKRLHLCMQTAHANRLIQMPLWDACRAEFDESELAGAECYGGLDVATEKDLAAFCLFFPETGSVLVWFWLPEENAELRQSRDGVPYATWLKDGHIEPTTGSFISHQAIVDRIIELSAVYDIRSIAFDRAQAAGIYEKLEIHGIPMFKHGQTANQISGPTKKLMSLIGNGTLRHNGNPVLNWNAMNVVGAIDAYQRVRPDRDKSLEKIDGILALIMAVGMHDAAGNMAPTTVYERENRSFVEIG